MRVQILPTVPWYKERLLTRISLGSLMVIILIRTVKYNLSRLRVSYCLLLVSLSNCPRRMQPLPDSGETHVACHRHRPSPDATSKPFSIQLPPGVLHLRPVLLTGGQARS